MGYSDLLIDLNDIYGRMIPGMFLLIDLYLIINVFTSIEPEKILKYLKDYPSIAILFILMFFIFSHIIGEFSLHLIFRFRRNLIRKTPLENLKELDVTKEKDLITFFESKFSKDSLNSKSSLMSYCKDYLLENSIQAYIQARKIEARINLKGGMIIPLIILGGICFLYQQWPLSLFAFSLAVIFFNGFRKSFKSEDKFIYKAYYNSWTSLHRLDDQSKGSRNT